MLRYSSKYNNIYAQLKKVPIDKLAEMLCQSRTQIYKLVNAGLLTPHYFGDGFTKPFFDLEEVEKAMCPEPTGGVKRRTYIRKEENEPA